MGPLGPTTEQKNILSNHPNPNPSSNLTTDTDPLITKTSLHMSEASRLDGSVPESEPPLSIRLTQRVSIAALVALIVLSVLWELWLAPLRPGGSWLCLKALPLCIPLTGLLKNRLYTYRWLSLWIWFYFIEGVVRTWGDAYPSKLYAGLEILICIILFGACAMHVRYRFQNANQSEDSASKQSSDQTS